MTRAGIQIQFGNESNKRLRSQFDSEPVSMKSKIADALVAILKTMPKLQYVAFDKVRLYASDFNNSELPAAQFIDEVESVVHEMRRKRATWNITLEVVDKPDENGYVSQRTMWNLEYQIARKIWANPKLGIDNVIQAQYLANNTDLHLLEPYYLLRLSFLIEYYENLTGEC